MQQPPIDATRASSEHLETFVHQAALRVNMPEAHAALLARLLVVNDLRGVLTHGTQQLSRYVHEIQTGTVNPQPNIHTANETPTSLLIDGGGGLGYFPAYDGTQRTIEKARQYGMAILVTRNHGHIGAAGIYTRLAAEHDLCALAMSGVQLHLAPGRPFHIAGDNPPISFSAPAGDEPPFVLDCGIAGRLNPLVKHGTDDALGEQLNSVVIRMVGVATACQAWGGLLSGVPIDPARADRAHAAAHQGAIVLMFDPALFMAADQFKNEIDAYARHVRQLTPLENTEGAFLPGGVEFEREKKYRREGIPLSERHQQQLENLANELDLPVPWG